MRNITGYILCLKILDFPEKVNFYVMGCVAFYKSMWPEIKSNAALFTGNILSVLRMSCRVELKIFILQEM